MALVVPVANLKYSDPNVYGYLAKLPLSRDWRPDQRWIMAGGVEFIEPLGAIGPKALPVPTALSTWTLNPSANQTVRSVLMPGSPPVLGVEFGDGAVYAAGTSPAVCAAALSSASSLQPNVVLRMARHAPPPDQGVVPQTTLSFRASLRVAPIGSSYMLHPGGTWTDGMVTLALPLGSKQYTQAVLWWALGRSFSMTTPEATLSEHHASQSMDGGEARETWLFEYVEDPLLFTGGHILIRNSSDPSAWWHTYDPNVRLQAGPVTLLMAGCRQQVNVSPAIYSATGLTPTATADKALGLPSLEWDTAATWGTLNTAAAGWTVGADYADDDTARLAYGYRPKVTFTPSGAGLTVRPIVWLATEDHAAELAAASVVASQETDGLKLLKSLSLHLDGSWQGATGQAELHRQATAPLSAWLPGGQVIVEAGWQQEAGATADADTDKQQIATLFVLPDGLPRELAAPGLSGLSLSLGDLIAARMDATDAVDMRQAAGQVFSDWAHRVGYAIGLSDDEIRVAAAIAAMVIPTADLPSKPHLWPQDGQSLKQHVSEVCRVCGVRWGWDGDLFFDAGRPVWTGGTADLQLDADSGTVKHRPLMVRHERSGDLRTALKVVWGEEGRKLEHYYLADAETRENAGWVQWAVVDDIEATGYAAALAEAQDKHGETGASTIKLEGVARPKLLPDKFIEITDCPEIDLETGAVYQITDHDLHFEGGRQPRGHSTITARRVYSPAEHAAATTPVFVGTLGAGGL